jgi:DNA-binding beta-propeller fold protein YncE
MSMPKERSWRRGRMRAARPTHILAALAGLLALAGVAVVSAAGGADAGADAAGAAVASAAVASAAVASADAASADAASADAASADAASAAPDSARVNLRFEALIGQSGTSPGEFHRPLALAPTAAGGILVADTGNSRVQCLDGAGAPLWEGGGIGTAEGILRRPTSAAATGLVVYVLDELGLAIRQFHARGEYQGVALDFRRPDLDDRLGQVDPRGLAVGRSGSILVTDAEGDRLLVFATDWALEQVIGGFGAGAQSFEDPEGVAAAGDRIYVADSGNGRIQVLDFMGRFIAAWPLPAGGRPFGIALDATGNVYVADQAQHRVLAFAPSGKLLGAAGAAGRGPGSFRGPSGVCVIGNRLFVADSENDRLVRFAIERAPAAGP